MSASPAEVCAALLAALESAEGRRSARKRDQVPDAIGLAAKHALLARVVAERPPREAFEAWLVAYAQREDGFGYPGTAAAMARAVHDEWQLAQSMAGFAAWLAQGAPSDDRTRRDADGAASRGAPSAR